MKHLKVLIKLSVFLTLAILALSLRERPTERRRSLCKTSVLISDSSQPSHLRPPFSLSTSTCHARVLRDIHCHCHHVMRSAASFILSSFFLFFPARGLALSTLTFLSSCNPKSSDYSTEYTNLNMHAGTYITYESIWIPNK